MQVEVDAYGRRLALNRPLIQQEDMVWDFELFNPWLPPNTGLYGPSTARPDLRKGVRGQQLPPFGSCGSCPQAPCSSWISYMHRAAVTAPRGPTYVSRGFGPQYPAPASDARFLFTPYSVYAAEMKEQ